MHCCKIPRISLPLGAPSLDILVLILSSCNEAKSQLCSHLWKKLIDQFRGLPSCSTRFTNLGAVTRVFLLHPKGRSIMEFRRDSKMGHTSRPNHWVESCPFWEVGCRSCPASNSLPKEMSPGCLESSTLGIWFSNWQFQRSEKAGINLKLHSSKTATGSLCLPLLLSQGLKNMPLLVHLPLEGQKE